MADQCDPYLIFCLAQIGCEQYIPVFIDNEIDFESFKCLTEDDLRKLLDGKLGPQKKILKEIERIKSIDDEFSSGELTVKINQMSTQTPSHQQQITPIQKDESTQVQIIDEPVVRTTINRGPNDRIQSHAENNSNTNKVGTELPPVAGSTKPVDESIMAKYGFVLPSAGAFATSIAVGTAQKYFIDEIVWKKLFPKTAGTVPHAENGTTGRGVGSDATGGSTVNGDAGTGQLHTTEMNINMTSGGPGQVTGNDYNPARAEFLAKYGNPNDPPNTTGRSMMGNDQNSEFIANDTIGNYSSDITGVGGYQDTGAVDTSGADFGAVDTTLMPDTGAADVGLFDGIIDGIFSNGTV